MLVAVARHGDSAPRLARGGAGQALGNGHVALGRGGRHRQHRGVVLEAEGQRVGDHVRREGRILEEIAHGVGVFGSRKASQRRRPQDKLDVHADVAELPVGSAEPFEPL